jgi:hypothetical protein
MATRYLHAQQVAMNGDPTVISRDFVGSPFMATLFFNPPNVTRCKNNRVSLNELWLNIS